MIAGLVVSGSTAAHAATPKPKITGAAGSGEEGTAQHEQGE